MRKLRYNAATTLDGFIASPDGSAQWIVEDPSIDFDALYAEFDVFVMGRKTYEVMISFGDPSPLASRAKENVVVISREMKPEEHPTITILKDNYIDVIRRLKEADGRDIWLMGGGQLAQPLLDAGLVDTIEAAVMPVVIGSGIKMIAQSEAHSEAQPGLGYRLELLSVDKLQKTGILMTKYKVDAQDSSKPNKPRMMSLASLYPEHKWIVSCLGKDRAQWWIQEALKRDQDSFELHFYNKYSVYGKHEVVDNVFRQFDKVAGKKKDGGASYREYWAEIEGFVYALSFILGEFVMSDDGDKCADTVELIGFMTIHALNHIKEQSAFGPDSDIQNLGTILAMLIYWVASTGCFKSHMAWAHHIMKMADEAGVTLGGPTKFSEAKEEIFKEPPSASDLEECRSFSWKSKVNAYMKRHKTYTAEGIPAPQGDFFDLTTMTAAERKKAAQPSGGFW